jgi:hypothetical protein
MKHRPILFSTAMVQAILDGRKTQTRRVCRHQHWSHHEIVDVNVNGITQKVDRNVSCPYGQPGDVLWVRETWAHTSQLNINPEDENYGYVYKADGQPWEDYEGWTWKPSIHMPRESCRLFLRIKSIRVERLQDISGEDALKEGVSVTSMWPVAIGEAYVEFSRLWASINGQASWDANPWVWVVEFERITKEEAEV